MANASWPSADQSCECSDVSGVYADWQPRLVLSGHDIHIVIAKAESSSGFTFLTCISCIRLSCILEIIVDLVILFILRNRIMSYGSVPKVLNEYHMFVESLEML